MTCQKSICELTKLVSEYKQSNDDELIKLISEQENEIKRLTEQQKEYTIKQDILNAKIISNKKELEDLYTQIKAYENYTQKPLALLKIIKPTSDQLKSKNAVTPTSKPTGQEAVSGKPVITQFITDAGSGAAQATVHNTAAARTPEPTEACLK